MKPRPPAPSSTRLTTHRRIERGPGIALPIRLLLAVAVVALGAGVLLLATGGLGRVAAAIGSTVSGLVTSITSTPQPSASDATVADAPTLAAPGEAYTNQKSIDLVGTVPADIAGDSDYRIRIYVAIGDGPSAPVIDVPVGPSQHFLVPGLQLSEGTNVFQATIVGPDNRESERSAAVSYILDTQKPRITLSSPKANAVINGKTVQLVGQTQARSALSVRNTTTNATVTGSADGTGAFTIPVPLGTGSNTLQITATDPAGNVNTAKVTVRHGTGVLTANVSASVYQVRVKSLPQPITLSVLVTDPDGKALAGAAVTFTITIPNVPAIVSSQLTTSSSGRATFTTTIPKGAVKGQALVTVSVDAQTLGKTTDRTVVNLN